MDITFEPLRLEDLDEFVRIHWDAFEPLEVDMLMPMIYPNGLQPDLIDRLRTRVIRETNGDLGSKCFVARDTSTGQIVGVSWWAVVPENNKTKTELDEDFRIANEKRNGGPPVAGMNKALGEAFFRAAFYSEYEDTEGKPYVTLRLLATRPSCGRKGIGSRLLEHGLAKFDPLGLPTYLDAGKNGMPLYQKYGFEITRDFPCDGREWGGRSEGKHWCMMRPAQM